MWMAKREIWKPIVGYEGLYEISNYGNIRSMPRVIMRKDGKPYAVKTIKVLKPCYDKDGYLRIELNNNGVAKKYYVHRLVANSFIPNNSNKSQVNHKNAVKDDNSIENLEWVTNQENRDHAVKNKLQPLQHGIKNPNVKLTVEKVLKIKRLKREGIKPSVISKITNVPVSNVNNIINNYTWSWLKDGEKRHVQTL